MLLKYSLPAILWAVLILILTLFPGQYIPPPVTLWDFIGVDKIVHAVLFGVLTILLTRGFRKQYTYSRLRYYAALVAVVLSLIYGASTEIIQGNFMKDRYFEFFDMLANATGCILGLIILIFVDYRHKTIL